jgi:hypothetical protein
VSIPGSLILSVVAYLVCRRGPEADLPAQPPARAIQPARGNRRKTHSAAATADDCPLHIHLVSHDPVTRGPARRHLRHDPGHPARARLQLGPPQARPCAQARTHRRRRRAR